jgi:beta-glucosidase
VRVSADELHFPDGFRWGVATSAFQNEGAVANPSSTWARWEALGHVRAGNRSGVACDWWEQAEGDFDRARDLNLNALRLSIDWARVEPTIGRFDDAALARYHMMLRALRERGLEPMACLHHFDQPVWFEDMGGFEHPGSVDLYVRFAARVIEALGDVCREWLTFNEPNVYAAVGYVTGDFPPGRRGATLAALRVQRNMARAHARAYGLIHAAVPGAFVSWAHHVMTFVPDRPGHAGDRWAAAWSDRLFNRPFLEVIADGRSSGPPGLRIDVPEARGTCDFLGVNLYGRRRVRFSPREWRAAFNRFAPPGPDAPRGDPGAEEKFGEPFPQGIGALDEWLARLGKPLVITENGYADALDRVRPAVIVEALRALHRLIERGFDVRGYHHWTLVDNFEWDAGWDLRFGLYELDLATQARNVRRSGRFYGEVARRNGLDRQTIVQHDVPGVWP